MRPILPLVLGALALGACDDTPSFRSETGPVPAAEQRPGDPEAGYRALVNEPYVSCGIPYDAYARASGYAAGEVPDASVPGREGRNAELPYALTSHVNEDGVEIVSSNCLTCHASEIDGEVVVGLGNEFADFTGDPRRVAMQSGSYVRGEAETAAWSHWADRIEGIAPYIRTATVGVNPATNLTWALMAHRDPETLEWSETPLIEPPQAEPLPVSVPPWWGMRHKDAMFYTTIGRGDHSKFMLLASMLCIESYDEVEAVQAYADDIRAYIASLEAPAYPHAIDRGLAAEGAALYADGCASCHGTYGEDASYPDRVYPLDEIGTDPTYATWATDGSRDRFYEWITRSPYGTAQNAAPAPGYIAPPLDGVWATAPYLHNGSVPSLAALLSPEDRPTYWRHRRSPKVYDREAVGWAYDALDHGQADEPDAEARRLIYDTTRLGYGNQGHVYGAELGERGRAALIEYLKTL
ncbi:MAG: c-type cytochrome [Paracoccaceae bacterium]